MTKNDLPPPGNDPEFGIEKGVAMPPRSRASLFPFDKMEVGDSFLVPKEYVSYARNALASRNIKHKDKHFESRSADGAMRIWRTR